MARVSEFSFARRLREIEALAEKSGSRARTNLDGRSAIPGLAICVTEPNAALRDPDSTHPAPKGLVVYEPYTAQQRSGPVRFLHAPCWLTQCSRTSRRSSPGHLTHSTMVLPTPKSFVASRVGSGDSKNGSSTWIQTAGFSYAPAILLRVPAAARRSWLPIPGDGFRVSGA